jgi:hypothetical protein
MAQPGTEAPQQQAAEGEQESESIFTSVRKNAKYFLLIYLAINTATSFINSSKSTDEFSSAPHVNSNTTGTSGPVPAKVTLTPNLKNSSFIHIPPPANNGEIKTDDEGNNVVNEAAEVEKLIYENSLRDPLYLTPFYEATELFDFQVFVNDVEEFDAPSSGGDGGGDLKLSGVKISDIGSISKNIKIDLTDNVKNNGSLYLHAFISKHGDDLYGYKRYQLNNYFPKRKQVKLHKLIGNEKSEREEISIEETRLANQNVPVVSYWHPNVTLILSNPPGLIDLTKIPPPLADVFPLDPTSKRDNLTGAITRYFPLIYQNKFWQLKDHMTEINSTLETVELNLNIDSGSFFKIQALVVITDGIQEQQKQLGSIGGGVLSDGSEFDSIKKILLETNAYLLAITVIVSLFHSLLEFLAFKSDISHWKNKKNNVGVSVRSIVANVIQQIITLLYLIDNSDGTSYMILASQGFGILVEAWKITTIIKVEIKQEPGKLLPTLLITDKYELSETEVKTKEYDSIAFKYLYLVAGPLLLAYSAYSVVYKEYKSWYSFIVTTLVGFVYTYGFLTLVPSVYINYRLKSVAHVPKKAMAYKVVNTFIDDLFAFVIKMPWLHRLATLRDDVIFFIYLYQTWIYRTDYARVNEFGQVGEDGDEVLEDVVEEKVTDGESKLKNSESEPKPQEKKKDK